VHGRSSGERLKSIAARALVPCAVLKLLLGDEPGARPAVDFRFCPRRCSPLRRDGDFSYLGLAGPVG
jgi:hypothetical protein